MRAIETVAFIGLGTMGGPMAATLARAGFTVRGVDASAERRAAAGPGVEPFETVAEACAGADAVLLSLPGSPQVEQVLLGDPAFLAAVPAGALVIDTTTGDPAITRRIGERLRERGHALLDAPVSGGAAGAATGALTLMVGGDQAAFERAEPLLHALSGGRHQRVGGQGAGHLVKLLNNLLCAVHLLTASEAARIAAAGGIDPARFVAAINGGSGRSGVTEVNYPRWIEPGTFDSGFTMGLMRRDVGLALQVAGRLGADTDVLRAAGEVWDASRAQLGDAEDFNRIVELDRSGEEAR
ncbi:NAD(P)-binding domain-containing protein [Conexibacter arvalis]|uniref:3-hydroxyisobutyrate dehydrogenase n=1 Tax=Conexibacter arvalis TaxID=912552 RepID=A0A840IHM5_9ACTN|nr:3-hydroxyisobutyrate dehydrogenase [Conexibacter arvalis]